MNTELKNFYTDDVAQKREDLFKNSAFQNDTQQVLQSHQATFLLIK